MIIEMKLHFLLGSGTKRLNHLEYSSFCPYGFIEFSVCWLNLELKNLKQILFSTFTGCFAWLL